MKKQEFKTLVAAHNAQQQYYDFVTSSNVRTFIRKKRLAVTPENGVLWMKEVEHAQHVQFQKQRAEKFKMSYKTYLAMQEKSAEILKSFHTGHSMGCVKHVLLSGDNFLTVEATEKYANSCKFRPTHGSFDILLTRRQLKELELVNGTWQLKNGCQLQATGVKNSYKVTLS